MTIDWKTLVMNFITLIAKMYYICNTFVLYVYYMYYIGNIPTYILYVNNNNKNLSKIQFEMSSHQTL